MLRLATGRASYWLRGVTSGAILAAIGVLAIGLAIAAARDEQPFRRGKLVPSVAIDATAEFGVPVAAAVGALLGGGLAEYLWRIRRLTRRF
jgi:hypothetical protein